MSEASVEVGMSAFTRAELEDRLNEWAHEYLNSMSSGWAGGNILAALIDHKGFIPSSTSKGPSRDRTPGEEVDDIVNSMQRAGWWLHARILRMEYWRPEPAFDQRLEIIRSWGVTMRRSGYFTKLAEAKLFVAGALFHKQAI